jgi:hypothetical protein
LFGFVLQKSGILYLLSSSFSLQTQLNHYQITILKPAKNRVVRASDSQCATYNYLGFDPSILRHSGIWGAADEAVLQKLQKNPKLTPHPPVVTVQKIPEKAGKEIILGSPI